MRPDASVCSTEARTRAEVLRGSGDWYRISNADEGVAEIFIYDVIGMWGITAAEFVRELREVEAERIVVRLNTPGGDVFDGIAIYTALSEHPAEIETRVDGVAASIGSVIMQAGDKRVVARPATTMIHDPWSIALGDAREMRKEAELLDQLGDTIAGVYADRAGGAVSEWRSRMLAETWYTGQETVDAGLADELASAASDDVENHFDLSIFHNTPQHLLGGSGTERQPTKRDVERALRDEGLSWASAKAVIAGGWTEPDGNARDERALRGLRDLRRGCNERTD